MSVQFKEMDKTVMLREQLFSNADGSVVLINVFSVDPGEVDALLEAWTDDANFFRSYPGLMSTQLHRGIAGSCTFLNYAVWESLEAFREAFTNPVFQEKLAKYPSSSTASPHLFQKLAVKGLCTS
ncbi:Heme-degrading monooxygenase HmoA [Variovorax sp. YR752]|uniref:antibiotic biosynthesis monooxygenase family protein n=1 Tax=unclassified Variovorax TaxID=663243 RepID=UPI000BDCD296|nr:antibiotic biosynthesis monooxygenase family protein [Variovorax sp. YR752]SOE06281.1 Heme-degrading monooxygenase HmoA [Variovorax sp. YR752]